MQVTSNEQNLTKKEQKAKSNEQKVTCNKQRAKRYTKVGTDQVLLLGIHGKLQRIWRVLSNIRNGTFLGKLIRSSHRRCSVKKRYF